MRHDYRSDRLLVVDLELTCWDGPTPPDEEPEPIEIAVVEVDTKALAIGRTGRWLVRPTRSTLSPFCSELTGITLRDLARQARPLGEVTATVARTFGTARKTWAAWGMDAQPLAEACARNGVKSPFSDSFLDLAQLFSMLAGTSRRIGLDVALGILGTGFEGQRHRALDDARNTATIYMELARRLRRAGLEPPDTQPNDITGYSKE
ncbi:exonuclease domain-containing protein [Arenibaculum pallidiluteum]|uniref:exonuclease domain-containing protein n=1 Tax=Arenibaculum pallidiluteum TaxID=2812559 RepID=UPI001A95B7DC|nr:3'-5' exonuclease [Arenibaculum pallidiluteum]